MPGLKLELETTRHGEFFFFPVLQANSILTPSKFHVYRHLRWADHEIGKKHRKASIGNRHRIGKRRAAGARRGKMGFLWCPASAQKRPS